MRENQTAHPAAKHQAYQEYLNPAAQEAAELVGLAKTQPLGDGGMATAQMLSQALELDPCNHEAQVLQERLHQTFVPRWHFPMLADTARNKAYAEAIAAKVKPGDVVLDIGCGAGLTAMLAARAGAGHVYTCEHQPMIAQAAERVIAANGLSDRITVIPKWSHNIIVGVDMPEAADVVISEIVDTVLLGEGALATLTHAMSALAKPDARAIPERGSLTACLVESPQLLNLWRPQQAEGFDLSAFHGFARVAQITPNDLAACEMRPLGAASELFAFDFTRPTVNPARTTEELGCSASGTAHAVFVSFAMDLAPGVKVANGLNSGGHWGRTAFLLDQPRAVGRGDQVVVTAQHDSETLSVAVHDAAPAVQDAAPAKIWMNAALTLGLPSADHSGLAAAAMPVWHQPDISAGASGGQSYH